MFSLSKREIIRTEGKRKKKKRLKGELHSLKGINLKTGIFLQGLESVPDTRAGTGSLPPNRTVAWVLQHPRRNAVTLGLVSFVLRSQAASQGSGRGKTWNAGETTRF